ncbi:MAG: serine/threonine-protein kinase [Gammaproteobacteria bacterium]|nr:serine/threonine-protein kinase [Gammaproteobacteria bacterium]
MSGERWHELERLYHAALELDPGERSAFLASACADEALRREVSSLLDSGTRADGFLELGEAAAPGGLAGRVFDCYRIEALIAVGGMGEVYRAVDTRLGRVVAVKVLPAHLSGHPERRERLMREARLVSSLSHPHVCALFDVGAQDGVDYLVMEHIDGETLQERLTRGRMRWHEALQHLTEIGDALAAAHAKGIVHRDLKPANVMLTKAGVKVLDFGVAARLALPAAEETTGLTSERRIVGTVPYMAPEQLQGAAPDARTDVFALGTLAFEMLVGRPAFTGSSQADVIGAIMRDQPEPIEAAVPEIPPLLARTVARCLAKDPEARWQTSADLVFQLRSLAEFGRAAPAARLLPPRRHWRRAAWAAALVACAAAGLFLGRRGGGPALQGRNGGTAIRFPLLPPAGTGVPAAFDVPFALSRDGSRIAYVVEGEDRTRRLWLRDLDSEQPRPLVGTEGAASPFWSPDGQWVGFFAANSLKKVRVTSPVVRVIASPAWSIAGAAWSARGVIVFPGSGGIVRVPADGGPVTPVGHESSHRLWPQFLEDGDHYLYSSFAPRTLFLGSLASADSQALMTFPVNVSAVSHVPGFVLYVQDGVLLARPFDERRRAFSGEARRLVDGVPVTGPGRAPFSVAGGALAYSTEATGTTAVLRWYARGDAPGAAVGTPARYFGFALSPDGRRLAFARAGANGGPDLWIRDLRGGAETQLTFDGLAFTPRWSPDGSRIVFAGIGERPPPDLFVRNAAGPAAATSLGDGLGPQFPASWEGSFVLSVSVGLGDPSGNDLWLQPAEGGRRERLPVSSSFNENDVSLTADHRWLAYTSDRSGRDEIWVARLGGAGEQRQVSAGGGTSPHWCRDGHSLVYLSPDDHLVSVPFDPTAERPTPGTPSPIARLDGLVRNDRTLVPTWNPYAGTRDCGQFLAATRPPERASGSISIVVNWPELLRR